MIQVTFLKAGKDANNSESGFYDDHSKVLENVADVLESEPEFVAVLIPQVSPDFTFEDVRQVREYDRETIKGFALSASRVRDAQRAVDAG